MLHVPLIEFCSVSLFVGSFNQFGLFANFTLGIYRSSIGVSTLKWSFIRVHPHRWWSAALIRQIFEDIFWIVGWYFPLHQLLSTLVIVPCRWIIHTSSSPSSSSSSSDIHWMKLGLGSTNRNPTGPSLPWRCLGILLPWLNEMTNHRTAVGPGRMDPADGRINSEWIQWKWIKLASLWNGMEWKDPTQRPFPTDNRWYQHKLPNAIAVRHGLLLLHHLQHHLLRPLVQLELRVTALSLTSSTLSSAIKQDSASKHSAVHLLGY